MSEQYEKAAELFKTLQSEICSALEKEDGGGSFRADEWTRPGGGGGVSRVLRGGNVFEKAGVNWSGVDGELPEEFAAQIPGDGREFKATGVSLVLHPNSPMVPTTHANFRYLEKGDKAWFGGGGDLTPYYLFEQDAALFHSKWKDVCDAHSKIADYDHFKKWCDDYFYLPHREEARGIGGIFFDYLNVGETGSFEEIFAFVKDAGRTFIQSYLPIVQRTRKLDWGPRQKQWQRIRRGRYVEFNLIYDRGTVFGLKTKGRTESILMSLPADVGWEYMHEPEPGSPEAKLLEGLTPCDWASWQA